MRAVAIGKIFIPTVARVKSRKFGNIALGIQGIT